MKMTQHSTTDSGQEVEWVPASLQDIQQVGHYLLRTMDDLTKKIGVDFFLDGGTLLGAVRSGGWIPWDDDIDVSMLRKDFDLFRSKVRGILPTNVTYSDPIFTYNHVTEVPRLQFKDSQVTNIDKFGFDPPEYQKIILDIFVVDKAPENPIIRDVWLRTLRGIQIMHALRCAKRKNILNSASQPLTKQFVLLAKLCTHPISGRHYAQAYNAVASMWKHTTSELTVISNSSKHYRSVTHQLSRFLEERETVLFEGDEYEAPSPQPYLAALYGANYLLPPPEDERLGHYANSVLIRGADADIGNN